MRALVVAVALLAGACTPGEAIWVAFHRHGNDVVHQANQVARCESRMQPDAVSPTNDHGLFQLNAVHAASHPDLWPRRYEPLANALMAERLWREQGWRPWACRGATR